MRLRDWGLLGPPGPAKAGPPARRRGFASSLRSTTVAVISPGYLKAVWSDLFGHFWEKGEDPKAHSRTAIMGPSLGRGQHTEKEREDGTDQRANATNTNT